MPEMPCPQCAVLLNIPDVLVGKLVSCRQCGHQFVASGPVAGPPPSQSGSADTGAFGGHPFGPAPPPPAPGGYGPMAPPGYPGIPLKTSGHAVASLVLGIISIPMCSAYGIPSLICGILAVVFAGTANRELAAGHVSPNSAGLARAGKICGWIGIALSILLWGIIIVAIIVGASMPAMMH